MQTPVLSLALIILPALSFARLDAEETDIWASKPILNPPLPQVRDAKNWARNGIDRFILAKLESERVEPSAPADRPTMIRRLHLDLIGLPPTPHALQHWMHAPEDDWYERLVDSLLASVHYGERWGRYWLDQARFADSDGYEKDRPRPHVYHWRDWVIDAFNADLPFDQFTEQQIAGDLLPGATDATRLATGFHRNTLTNREGGIDQEEDRVKQVVDRINTISTVWLGLTVRCAQCHTHKYDPITIDEYYQLYAFFNDADESNFQLEPTPRQKVDYQQALDAHNHQVAQTESRLSARTGAIRAGLPDLIANWKSRYPDGVSPSPTRGLALHLPFDSHELSIEKEFGKVLALDGKSQSIALSEGPEIASDRPFSLSVWVYRTSDSGGLVTKMDEQADFRGIDVTTLDKGMIEVHLVDTWPQNAAKVTTSSRVLLPNQWHHLLVCYDGSKQAKGVAIFVDGQSQDVKVNQDSLKGNISLDEPWRIGSRKHGTFFGGMLDEVRIYERRLPDEEIQLLADARYHQSYKLAATAVGQGSTYDDSRLLVLETDRDSQVRELRERLEELRSNPPKVRRGTAMGMAQRDSPRKTFVQNRGDFLDPGVEVQPTTPGFLHPLEARGTYPDRLDLARWILSPKNTYTPRVTVNRIWQQYFGRGIVASGDDFGTQGELPSHPGLLDWLATRFVDGGWSMKSLHRLIVTSGTYRQSSAQRPELRERDPYNTWLTYQNRKRVEAEVVRDLALAASGLLDERVLGPSVFPQLPPGVIELAFVDVINRGPWKLSPGGDRYRRGLYTFVQRTAPYPMLSAFDAPDSTVSCTRREASNTPIQALTLWNDPVFTQCAQALALRIMTEAPPEARVRHAFAVCLNRTPTSAETSAVETLYVRSRRMYQQNPQLTQELIESTETPGNVDPVELGGWFSVARTFLNLDEFVTRQ